MIDALATLVVLKQSGAPVCECGEVATECRTIEVTGETDSTLYSLAEHFMHLPSTVKAQKPIWYCTEHAPDK